jgi:MFS family permease
MTADIIPSNKRGEAMGYIGFFSTLGMALGPYIGSEISLRFHQNYTFYTSSFFAFLSVFFLLFQKESLKETRKFNFSFLQFRISEFFEKVVLFPAIIYMFYSASFGIFLTFIPDYSFYLGFENKGIFFIIFTLATMSIRLFAAKISDRIGRLPVLKYSMPILFISFLSFAIFQNKEIFILASILYGIAAGFISPTLFAWTVDRADESKRGSALATLFIAMEIGIGYGALFSGILNNFFYHQYQLIFSLCTITAIIAWILCYLPDKYQERVFV